MALPAINSSGQFGISQVTVCPTPGLATFTAISPAITYAAANGVASVYVYPGTYTENLTMPAAVLSLNASPDQVTVIGNHTMTTTGSAFFTGMNFISPGGITWTVGTGGGPGVSTIQFNDCSIIATAGVAIAASSSGGGTNLSMYDSTITASGNAMTFSFGSCTIQNDVFTSSTSDTIFVGQSATVQGINNAVNSTVGNGVIISSPSALWITNFTQYTTAMAGIKFTAAGNVISVDEGYNSSNPNGFYVDTSGPVGTFRYALLVLAGMAQQINPLIDAIVYPQSGTSAGLTWIPITASQPMSTGSGYIVTAGTVSLSLPAASSVGQQIGVVLSTGTSWTITQALGQQIQVGSTSSTSGASGSLSSNNVGDAVVLVCTVANSQWIAVPAPQGNLTIM